MKSKTRGPVAPDKKVINSLKEVLAIIETPVICRFKLDGQEVELNVRRAMTPVLEKRRELLRSVQPPFVKERNDYDMLNPQFMTRRDQVTLQARALTVYQCCPEVAALQPGLMEPAKIHEFISARLPENIIEMIELTALSGGMDIGVTRRANFISPDPLES